jgi:hypothetical protein
MIYLTPGTTASIWMSLRESVTYGSTASFDFTFTNDITGATKSFTPTDLQPDNKWSRFEILVGTPESLPGTIDMKPGMWSYKVEAGSTLLETGKVIVVDTPTWTARSTPAKNTVVRRR